MPRGIKKENLPTKVCIICQQTFNWRKKWERCWDEVTTCSNRCNTQRRQNRKEFDRPVDQESFEGSNKSPQIGNQKRQQMKLTDNASPRAFESVEVPILPQHIILEPLSDPEIEVSIEEHDVAIRKEPAIDASNGAIADVDDKASTKSRDSDDDIADRLSSIPVELSVLEMDDNDSLVVDKDDKRQQRKAACKELKRLRRAAREGRSADEVGRKLCDLCSREVDLLIRCQMDETKLWRMVCGKCWKTDMVSGGVVDGTLETPHYRYGGIWKNLKRTMK